MFFNKQKQIDSLESKVESLKDTILEYRSENVRLNDIAKNHASNLAYVAKQHNVQVCGLERRLLVLESDIKEKINFEVDRKESNLIKDFKAKEARRQSEHEALIKKIKSESLDKLSKMDSKLENDKASYRKYLRTETNKEIDSLRTENTRLIKENGILKGENLGLNSSNKLMEGQVEASMEITNSIIKALPTITSEFTNPNAPSSNAVVGSNKKS